MNENNKRFFYMALSVIVVTLLVPRLFMGIAYQKNVEEIVKTQKPVHITVDKASLATVKNNRSQLIPFTYTDENNVKVQIPAYYNKSISTDNGIIITTPSCKFEAATYDFYKLNGKHEGILVLKPKDNKKEDLKICSVFISS